MRVATGGIPTLRLVPKITAWNRVFQASHSLPYFRRDDLVRDAEDAALSSQRPSKSPPSAERGRSQERHEQSLQDAAEAFILSQSQPSPPCRREEVSPPSDADSGSQGTLFPSDNPIGGAAASDGRTQHGVKRLREEDALGKDEVSCGYAARESVLMKLMGREEHSHMRLETAESDDPDPCGANAGDGVLPKGSASAPRQGLSHASI